MLSHGGISGQDNAFNQLLVLLPLLLCSSDEVKVTFVYLIFLSHEENLISPSDLNEGVLEGSLSALAILYLPESNANLISFEFCINTGFREIKTSLP